MGSSEFIKSQDNRKKIWILVLFGLYIFLLIWVVIFKARIAFPLVRDSRDINFIPFYYQDAGENDIPALEALANVLVFIPLGIYLKMLGIDTKKTVVGSLLLSLVFEITQFSFKIGVADITDLLTNTLGAAIGAFGYILLLKAFKKQERLNKVLNVVATVATSLASAVFLLFLLDEIIWRASI